MHIALRFRKSNPDLALTVFIKGRLFHNKLLIPMFTCAACKMMWNTILQLPSWMCLNYAVCKWKCMYDTIWWMLYRFCKSFMHLTAELLYNICGVYLPFLSGINLRCSRILSLPALSSKIPQYPIPPFLTTPQLRFNYSRNTVQK